MHRGAVYAVQVKHRADPKIAECVIAILQQYTAMNADRTLLTILVHMLAIINLNKINEETNCTFQFSYIIPSHKEAARQAADIYEYRNATRASSVLDESEELVVKINGTETKCAMWWTSKRKRIQFLWEDMYVVEISAPISKEKLMEVLNGLSFEEVSVSVKGE